MKQTLILLLALPLLWTACQKDEQLDQLPVSDQQSYEAMEEIYDIAYTYNDSLRMCQTDSAVHCTDSYVMYCDSLFHHYEHMWDQHHDDYNHENGHCDHRHDGMGMHHNDHHHGDDSAPHGHQGVHHDMMDDLMHDHEQYHP